MPVLKSLSWVVLPLASLLAFVLVLRTAAGPAYQMLASETGPIELGTAALFALAGAAALTHARRARGAMPGGYRALFVLYGLGCLFLALEEISYGQHLFALESSAWFAEHNQQQEIGLHNLGGNKPSHLMENLAYVLYPFGCVALPLWAGRRAASYRSGHWTSYLVPRGELIALVLVAPVCLSFKPVYGWVRPISSGEEIAARQAALEGPPKEANLARTVAARQEVGAAVIERNERILTTYQLGKIGHELCELYWSMATFLYVLLMGRRIGGRGIEGRLLEGRPLGKVRALSPVAIGPGLRRAA